MFVITVFLDLYILTRYTEDIYFFEVNTKYISRRVLKTLESLDVFNSPDDIYLVFTEKGKFAFSFILFRRFTVNQLTML